MMDVNMIKITETQLDEGVSGKMSNVFETLRKSDNKMTTLCLRTHFSQLFSSYNSINALS